MRDDGNNRDIEVRINRLERGASAGRWWKRATLVLIAGAVFVPLAADALGPVPHMFSTGGTISASEMNENFTHLQNGITAVEAQVPPDTCAADEIARFDGTGWICSTDGSLVAGDNIVVASGAVSLAPVPAVAALDMETGFRWNNSNSNGVTEMSVFQHDGTCQAATRGRVRVIEHEDIGNSTDIGDSLCFCQRYLDRTPDPDVELYRWVCLYRQSDGD